MLNWIRSFINANRQTKFFVINWAVYGIVIIVTTIYCYGRLDFVRSYRKVPVVPQQPIQSQAKS